MIAYTLTDKPQCPKNTKLDVTPCMGWDGKHYDPNWYEDEFGRAWHKDDLFFLPGTEQTTIFDLL